MTYKDLGYSKEEWDGLSPEQQGFFTSEGLHKKDISDSLFKKLQNTRAGELQGVLERNQVKTDLQRDIDFTKNDVYNAGMAANTIGQIGTLKQNRNENDEALEGYREPTRTPNAIQNQALQQVLSNSQYAQQRGLGADVIGNQNSQNNQAYINALGAAQQSSNQAGNFQGQNQALFNKMLMAGKGTANMQMQYQQMANQDLARNISGQQAQDAAQNNMNLNAYQTKEALRARDIGRGENRKDSFRNALQETYDTIPYKLAKQAGDYTNVREQRNLDPRQPSNFMQNNLFKRFFQPKLQGQQTQTNPNMDVYGTGGDDVQSDYFRNQPFNDSYSVG